jgi:CubicO group peptidase (beta-lactamase class C family)
MLVLALACAPSVVPVDTDPEPIVPTLDPAAIDAVLAAAEDGRSNNRGSGQQIAIWKNGVVYYVGAVGTADGARAIDEDTRFAVGSDTKKMTAIAALQAVAAGRLSTGTTVTAALPDLHFTAEHRPSAAITLHELLSHRSGLFDETPWDDDPDDASLAAYAYGPFAASEWAMSPPGALWNYSNPNFALAGLMVEASDGRAYADILEQDVAAPLGMERTVARLSELDDDAATGFGIASYAADDPFDPWSPYHATMGALAPSEQADNAFMRPAGGVWSTATDMCRLAGFLVDGDPDVLRDDLRQQIVTPQADLYPSWTPKQSYGYGMFLYPGFNLEGAYYETPFWVHGGNTLDMTSLLYVLPEKRLAVCILGNGYVDDLAPGAREAFRQWGDLPAPIDPVLPPPPSADLEKYVGTWTDPVTGPIVVAADGDGLAIRLPDVAARGHRVGRALTPVYADYFSFQVDGEDLTLAWVDGYVRNRRFVGTRGG